MTGHAAGSSPATSAVPLLVLSPHLDDAVFGAAALLQSRPGAVVATALAGTPPEGTTGEWDTTCGFATGAAAVAARRAEDRAALAALGARAVHLDLLDGQYLVAGDGPPDGRHGDGVRGLGDLQAALGAVIGSYPGAEVAAPLGLQHRDHVDVADAVIDTLRSRRVERWLVYGDYYRRTHPGSVPLRLDALDRRGIDLQPVEVPPLARWRQLRALARYRSQWPGLGRTVAWRAVRTPELLWEARWRHDSVIDLRSTADVHPAADRPAAADERQPAEEGAGRPPT